MCDEGERPVLSWSDLLDGTHFMSALANPKKHYRSHISCICSPFCWQQQDNSCSSGSSGNENPAIAQQVQEARLRLLKGAEKTRKTAKSITTIGILQILSYGFGEIGGNAALHAVSIVEMLCYLGYYAVFLVSLILDKPQPHCASHDYGDKHFSPFRVFLLLLVALTGHAPLLQSLEQKSAKTCSSNR